VPAFSRSIYFMGWGIFVSKDCKSDEARYNNLSLIFYGSGAGK
jgi:hypothetical protein